MANGAPRTDLDKRLNFVSCTTSEFDNLASVLNWLGVIEQEWGDMNYSSATQGTGITDADLTDTPYGHVATQYLRQAFNNYDTMKAAITQTVRHTFLRLCL